MGGVVGLSDNLQHPAHLRGIGQLGQADDRGLFAGEVIDGRGVGQDLIHMQPRDTPGSPRILDRGQVVQGVGGVHHPRPDRYRGSGGDRHQGPGGACAQDPGIPGGIGGTGQTGQIRLDAVPQPCGVCHRGGAFLRAQQVGVGQRIDIVVDLVEPGRDDRG